MKPKGYLISVSYETGCYRHIRVPADFTLEALSDEILDAFAFINDHAHAFFMSNVAWDRDDIGAYYMDLEEFEEEDEDFEKEYTWAYTLADLDLAKGQKFKYVFDYGENWIFQCRVLRELTEPVEEAEVVRRVGEPPEQYPGFDEDED